MKLITIIGQLVLMAITLNLASSVSANKRYAAMLKARRLANEEALKDISVHELENLISTAVGGRKPEGTGAMLMDTKPQIPLPKIHRAFRAKHTDKLMKVNHTRMFDT